MSAVYLGPQPTFVFGFVFDTGALLHPKDWTVVSFSLEHFSSSERRPASITDSVCCLVLRVHQWKSLDIVIAH